MDTNRVFSTELVDIMEKVRYSCARKENEHAHLSSINTDKVQKNKAVKAGDKIGVYGGSGYGKNNYYGRHLHFAIVDTLWTSGKYWGYATWFSGDSVKYDNVTYYNPMYVLKNHKLP